MSNIAISQATQLATSLGVQGDGKDLMDVLKATAFKGQVSDPQMTALLMVANQYGLNPWTKEIYAFPDRNNGIVPVVGVDGWSRIINSHAQFDGMDFEQDADGCTCIIYRKDRSHPVRVTEYMAECKRDGVGPWKSHPKRMLRHKAMIQCARLAFGFVGIYEQDEAERIVESKTTDGEYTVVQKSAPARTEYPAKDFDANFPKWRDAIHAGKRTPAEIIAMVESKGSLTKAQQDQIKACKTTIEGEFIAAGDSE